MSSGTAIFGQKNHWLLVVPCVLLISNIHARIQSLKESRVVTMEYISVEIIEVIVHKYSKKDVFKSLEEFPKK